MGFIGFPEILLLWSSGNPKLSSFQSPSAFQGPEQCWERSFPKFCLPKPPLSAPAAHSDLILCVLIMILKGFLPEELFSGQTTSQRQSLNPGNAD